MQKLVTVFFAVILLPIVPCRLSAQSWDFVKEKDGIRLFTRQDKNCAFKSFRGETQIRTHIEKVGALIGNPARLDWWGDDVRDIKVLDYQKDKHIKYYFIYDVPWPFTDRDLVADVEIGEDSVTGTRTVFSKPLLNAVPENPDLVRVKKYWQKWTLKPLDNGIVHVTLEGFIDPAGSVPAWLYNFVIIDTPLRLLREVRDRVQGP